LELHEDGEKAQVSYVLYINGVFFQSFRFTEEDHQILKSLFVHDGDANSYALRVAGGHWLGAWKFMMVSKWGEAGARLYHKLRDGLEPELTVHRQSAGKTSSQRQELTITLKCGDEETDTYTIDKIEVRRGPQVVSEHRIDWKRLAMEAASPVRTRAPPSLLFIRGHAKFEGEKLAKIHSTTQQKRKGMT
jgi:hypothetical protein